MTQLPFSQAAENNKEPILGVLRDVLIPGTTVLEIGSGTGQHAVWFAQNLPHLVWQPSEQAENLETLKLRLDAQAPANICQPVVLDVADDPWPVAAMDAVYAANCVHIMSFAHVEKMFQGLDKVVKPGGHLALYGPYKYAGQFTTDSNERFDQWLKSNDALSGIRDFEKVDGLASAIGMSLLADHQMPANNQLLIWQRSS